MFQLSLFLFVHLFFIGQMTKLYWFTVSIGACVCVDFVFLQFVKYKLFRIQFSTLENCLQFNMFVAIRILAFVCDRPSDRTRMLFSNFVVYVPWIFERTSIFDLYSTMFTALQKHYRETLGFFYSCCKANLRHFLQTFLVHLKMGSRGTRITLNKQKTGNGESGHT